MTPQADAATAGWTGTRERSQLWVLKVMRWFALTAGRRAARALLHPITLYFALTGGRVRRESARYLTRALGRRATRRDVYRHLHAFASTVLDRVYLLQGRYDAFELQRVGVECMDDALAHGEGIFMIGAHMGSFEALRAIGLQRGLKVAMVMYEDNARLINAALSVLAPR
jgi:predicted LPLAT superfamily acyltransferase